MSFALSVGIVNWNTRDAVLKLLKDLEAFSSLKIQILVADNASHDGSQEALRDYPGIQLLENQENLGFAKAHNQLWSRSKAPVHILLNSDLRLSKGVFEAALAAFKDDQVGIWGPQMLWENGEIQRSCRRFPSFLGQFFYATGMSKIFPKSRLFNGYLMGEFDHQSKREVDQIIGSFFAVKKKVWEQIGYLDDRFFMYYEEVDYCKRAKNAGFKILYDPSCKIVHLGGLSSDQIKLKTLRRTVRSRRVFFHKHFGWYSWLPLFVCLSLEAGTKTLYSIGKRSNPLKTMSYYGVAIWDFLSLKPANKA